MATGLPQKETCMPEATLHRRAFDQEYDSQGQYTGCNAKCWEQDQMLVSLQAVLHVYSALAWH